MADEWYYRNGSQELGPLSAADLKRMAKDGILASEGEVRKGKTAKWQSARPLNDGPARPTPKPKAPAPDADDESAPYSIDQANPCPSCGKDLPKKAVLCVSCGYDLKTGKSLKTNYGGKDKTLRIAQGFKGIVLAIVASSPFLVLASILEEPIFCVALVSIIPFARGTNTTISMTRDKKGRPICLVEKRICFFRFSRRRTLVTEHDSVTIGYFEANLGPALWVMKQYAGEIENRRLRKEVENIDPAEDGRVELCIVALKLMGKAKPIPICKANQPTMRAIIDLIQSVVRVSVERS